MKKDKKIIYDLIDTEEMEKRMEELDKEFNEAMQRLSMLI